MAAPPPRPPPGPAYGGGSGDGDGGGGRHDDFNIEAFTERVLVSL